MLTKRSIGMLIKMSLCLVLVLLIVFISNIKRSKANDFVHSTRINIVVESGDSLWSIAKKIAPGHDAYEVIWYLMRLNGKENKVVIAGEKLVFDYAALN